MANNKSKKAAAKSSSDASVVRIRASSAPSGKKEKASEAAVVTKVAAKSPAKAKETKAVTKTKSKRRATRPLRATGGYFKGAWVELRQVRWPNRRATWSLTGAVLLYSGFFVVLVLLLDAGFKYLFQLILGK